MNYRCILSLTTHGVRTKNVLRTLTPILSDPSIKVVLNIFAQDYAHLTKELFDLIFDGKIELFVSPVDLGPHLKYFFTMKRYSDVPVIVIDDDIIYPDGFIDELLQYHAKYSDCILSRRPEKISVDGNGNFVHYHLWPRPYFQEEPSHSLFATGVGGILFPPNCFSLDESNIRELVSRCKYDDDVYIKVLALRNGIKVKSVQSKTMYAKILDDVETQSIALCNTNWNRTISVLNSYKDEIIPKL